MATNTTRPRMAYAKWFRTQGINIGAVTRDEWYWDCPQTSCTAWGGSYTDPVLAKQIGLAHVHHMHR